MSDLEREREREREGEREGEVISEEGGEVVHTLISQCLSKCVILLLRSYRRWDADRRGGGGREREQGVPSRIMTYHMR